MIHQFKPTGSVLILTPDLLGRATREAAVLE